MLTFAAKPIVFHMNEPYVLHVDDDPDDRELVQDALLQINPALGVRGAADGSEAILFLQTALSDAWPPRLILLDLNMPVMSGRETLTALKNNPRTAGLPLVVFTTSHAGDDQLFCRRYGVELLTKPETFTQIKELLTRLVGTL